MKRILILGASGFSGRRFCQLLMERNSESALALFGADASEALGLPGKIRFFHQDLLEQGSLERLLCAVQPTHIINLAGTYGHHSLEILCRANAELSRNLLNSVAKLKMPVEKIVLIGSAAEYGAIPSPPAITEDMPLQPITPYGLSKVLQTQYALYYYRAHGLKICLARTFNILGKGLPSTLAAGGFLQRINSASPGETIAVGNLEAKRDFLDIEDVVAAYWLLLMHGKPGEVYNVCSGRSVSIREIFSSMTALSGKQLTAREDISLLKTGDNANSFGNNSKLVKDTGWQCNVGIQESVKRMFLQ
jgi:GDP-4-dehydro-6-deoxy-D-mannose reductase